MGGRASRNKGALPLQRGYNKVTFLKGNLWKRFGLQFCHASTATKTDTKFQPLAVSELRQLHVSREASLVEYLATHTTTEGIRRFFCGRTTASTRSRFTDWWQKLSLALGRLALRSITLMATRQTTELTILSGLPIKKTIGTPTGSLMAELQLNTRVKRCPLPRPALGMQWMVFGLKTHAEG